MKSKAIRIAIRGFLGTLLVLLSAHPGSPQNPTGTGSIKGTITDVSGAVVSGAEIKAANEATSQAQTASSTATGEFVFRNLPAGSYTVEVNARGFQTFRSTKILITTGAS